MNWFNPNKEIQLWAVISNTDGRLLYESSSRYECLRWMAHNMNSDEVTLVAQY